MTKRRLLRWSLILVILAIVVTGLEPTRVIWGWLRGEAFYQGRPTSWWAGELSRWEVRIFHVHFNEDGIKRGGMHVNYTREDSRFEQWCRKLLRDETPRDPPGALTGDPAAEAVLAQLMHHADEKVGRLARRGLAKMGRLNAYLAQEPEPEADPP